ncbi:MAG: signal peptidase I [Bdellovibrionales bacterium]|nr:signal peptidase I [Bdellovibrionales bacterium]
MESPHSKHEDRNTAAQWKTPSSEPSQLSELFSLIRSIAIFLAIAFMLRASVVEAFKIPSASMEPTLQIGDHILVNKLSYGFRLPLVKKAVKVFRNPKHGDVVVFTLPDDVQTPEVDESDTNIIKRIVGLPGDVVEIRGTHLFINNRLVTDEHAVWLQEGVRDFGPEVVPDGKVFLLGDNRDYSKDSRYWDDPFLDIARIKGKAFFIYWSWPLVKRMFSVIS